MIARRAWTIVDATRLRGNAAQRPLEGATRHARRAWRERRALSSSAPQISEGPDGVGAAADADPPSLPFIP